MQKRLIKFFVDQSKKDPEKYAKFFEEYGVFMREGIVTIAEQDVKVPRVLKHWSWWERLLTFIVSWNEGGCTSSVNLMCL